MCGQTIILQFRKISYTHCTDHEPVKWFSLRVFASTVIAQRKKKKKTNLGAVKFDLNEINWYCTIYVSALASASNWHRFVTDLCFGIRMILTSWMRERMSGKKYDAIIKFIYACGRRANDTLAFSIKNLVFRCLLSIKKLIAPYNKRCHQIWFIPL